MNTNNDKNLFKEEGYKVMGAAFEVYNELGYGLLEENLSAGDGNRI